MLSNYAKKIYLKKDLYAIFNSLIMEPLFVTFDEADRIFKNKLDEFTEVEVKQLYEKCILVDSVKQDKMAVKVIKDAIEDNTLNKVTMMYIIPNNNCNLECKYCFIGKLNNDPVYMKEETAYNAITKFVSHLKSINAKKGAIIFYGGEPLINFEIIKYSVKIIKQQNFPIDISIVTNATLLNESKAEFIKENNIALGVSIDGPKKMTDEKRVYKGNNDSVYDNVIKKLDMLKKCDVQFGLSITVSEEALKDKAKLIKWIKDNHFTDINYNPLHYSNVNENWKDYYNSIGNFIFNSNNMLFPLGISEDRVARKLRSFYERDFKYSDCGANGGNQITIRPDGDITICHGYWNISKNEIGNINDINFCDIFSSDLYKKWHKNLTVNKSECLKCPAIFICGGGCGMQSENLFGEVEKLDKPFCKYSKTMLKKILLDLYETNK